MKCITHFVQIIENSHQVYQSLYQVPRVAVTKLYKTGWVRTTIMHRLMALEISRPTKLRCPQAHFSLLNVGEEPSWLQLP